MDRKTLLTGLETGDPVAWREFLESFGRLIYAVTGRFPFDQDEQEDVFQNVCVAIHRGIGSLRDPNKLSSWVYGIAYRISINTLRKSRREVPAEDPEHHPGSMPQVDPYPGAEAELVKLEDAALVRDGVERLDPRCRTLITALYLSDPAPSYQELAEAKGVPLGSIGPTRARCLEKLRKLLVDVSNPDSEGLLE